MNARIVLLNGDGIGPEIVAEARKVLEAIAQHFGHHFEFEPCLIGGAALDETGEPLPDSTIERCKSCDAILLGAVGGPKWDDPSAAKRPEQGLLEIRQALGLFANLRPVRVFPCLADASPLRRDRLENVDILIVRELTGGLYFGQPRLRETTPEGQRAVDTLEYHEHEIRRVLELGFRLAATRRRRLCSVDKANVLETSRLWRHLATEIAATHKDITLEHQLVDSAAMRLVSSPSEFDVIVTENMFGDILSDEAAVLSGTLGVLPSASLGEGTLGLYEPIHGSAPQIAGQGIANPVGTILSAAMLLRHSLALHTEAGAIERAVEQTLLDGERTVDLGTSTPLSTSQMGDAIVKRIGS